MSILLGVSFKSSFFSGRSFPPQVTRRRLIKLQQEGKQEKKCLWSCIYVLPAWPEKTQATFQKPANRLSPHSNKYILIEKNVNFQNLVLIRLKGQIGRSQSYTIEKLLPNVDDNDEIVERKTFRNRKFQKHWSAIARSLCWSRIQVLIPAVRTPHYYGQFAF